MTDPIEEIEIIPEPTPAPAAKDSPLDRLVRAELAYLERRATELQADLERIDRERGHVETERNLVRKRHGALSDYLKSVQPVDEDEIPY